MANDTRYVIDINTLEATDILKSKFERVIDQINNETTATNDTKTKITNELLEIYLMLKHPLFW